ncbi:O-acetyl-ADP-ribose deacetylase [Polluticaenibacter yanchengensis]|uniref:O-acetyl-ADP-ribose deacetylase n=1 Tax=Polluticaenibacter yanchengensis TaxID=3014562 RepID=A0ABT4UKD0_9BACT|nr:O-acetyl-ADP-ribose deacetylase [Chitinophagaceae bacterium LY-5]
METITSRIRIIKGDITKIQADAIVNAANTSLLGGGGVDGAIHRAGGTEILEACRKIVARQGGCKVGEAVITSAGKLDAKFVIHTVGPVWNNGNNNEDEKLANCYSNSMKLAAENGCHSIAFPGISTGIYKFPKDRAAGIAIKTIYDFLKTHDLPGQVILVCFDDESLRVLNEPSNTYNTH